MTDTQVVIKAAKMVGWETFVDDDGFGNNDIGYYTTHNKVGHQLLMLAVLRLKKWDMVCGEYADYGKDNWGALTDDVENPIMVHNFDELPLAVLRAAVEKEGM